MKQTKIHSISLKREKNIKQNTIVLIPACFLLTFGFWGLLFEEWKLEQCGGVLLPVAVLSLLTAAGLLFLKEKKESIYLPLLLAMAAVAVLAVAILNNLFAGSLGTLLNQIREWNFLSTGWYSNPFMSNENPWPILLVISIVVGILTQLVVLYMGGHLVVLFAIAYLGLITQGVVSFSVWGGLFLLGCILTLAQGADGRATAGLWITGGFVVVGALVLGICLLFNLKGTDGRAGEKLLAFFHKTKYETTETSMPEGNLRDLGAYKPTEELALTVTADNWKTFYLRGFQGGTYTGTSWETLSPEAVDEEKELIDALQKGGLYPSSQLSEGWKALGVEAEDTISIYNTGACAAYNYLPYGGEASENLDPDSITGEGLDHDKTGEITTPIYPLEDSYLLMDELSRSGDGKVTEYLEKESAYRTFVYEHYLDIPEKVETLLTSHKLLGTTGIATVQACKEVKLLVQETLKYNEGTVFYNHGNDFLDYLLNIQPTGYSVHYATLAVMMLRSYGIPARYVEGYHIPASLTIGLEEGDSFYVTEAFSSAWVEYYADGVGWLVFDPVSGSTDTIKYNLPVGQGDADQQIGNIGFAAENRKQQDNTLDEAEDGTEETSEREKTGIRVMFLIFVILLLLLLLALIAMILRTCILRRRMRKRRERFSDPDPKVGTTAILCSLRELTAGSLHIPEEAFFQNPDHMVTELLEITEEEFLHWKRVADEIQFSTHPISEETRKEAGERLRKTEESWNAAVPLPRKILQKYILCKVY